VQAFTKKALNRLIAAGQQQDFPASVSNGRVRIKKPVVTYDLGTFSVTNCARLPIYFETNDLVPF
jgi:hypothetical protein